MAVRGPSWIVCLLTLTYCDTCSLDVYLPHPVCHNMNKCAYTLHDWPHGYRIPHCRICRFFSAERFGLVQQWP